MTPFKELTNLLAATVGTFFTASGGLFSKPEFQAIMFALKIIGGIATGILTLGILYLIIKQGKVTEKIDKVNAYITADPINKK